MMTKLLIDTADFEIQIVKRNAANMPIAQYNKKTRVYTDLGSLDPRANIDWSDDNASKKSWRQYQAYHKMNSTAAVEYLLVNEHAKSYATGFKIRFDLRAGCSCGCSCGCIIDKVLYVDGSPVDIYVKVKAGYRNS